MAMLTLRGISAGGNAKAVWKITKAELADASVSCGF